MKIVIVKLLVKNCLLELHYSVIEEVRLISTSVDRDTMEFIIHGGVGLVSTGESGIRKLNIVLSGIYNTFEFVRSILAPSNLQAPHIR